MRSHGTYAMTFTVRPIHLSLSVVIKIKSRLECRVETFGNMKSSDIVEM